MPEKNNRHEIEYFLWRRTPHGQEVFAQAQKESLLMAGRGHKHYSIVGIVHIIRYHRHLSHAPKDEYKINNNYRSWLAREVMAKTPDLPPNFFEVREAQ